MPVYTQNNQSISEHNRTDNIADDLTFPSELELRELLARLLLDGGGSGD